MANARIVLTTVETEQAAEHMARALLERRLAACVNVIGGVRSFYRWKGAVEESAERLLLIKTDTERLAQLEAAVRELHPYELPEFLVLAPEGGSAEYMGWMAENLG